MQPIPPIPRRELIRAALLLALACCVFLWEPLSNVRTSTFLTVDVLQNNTLTQIARNYQPRNQVLSDPFTEFVPWVLFAKAELLNGRIPLWNPMNGAGAPLIGNYQSAVFSLFTLPFYALELKFALLVTSLARLFAIGWFTYLFLRRAALGELAALGGALAFTFCGYNALLLSYPHSAVVAYLPAVLWCCEVILQRCESAWSSGARPRLAGWWVLLCGLLAGQTYAGHPETLFFCGLIVFVWVGTRLGTLAWRARGAAGGVATCAALAARMLLVAAIAVMLSAPQLLPFAEYVANSARVSTSMGSSLSGLPLEHWPRYVFPNLFGIPIDGQAFGAKLPRPNYEIGNLAYCGATAGLLALRAMLRDWRDPRVLATSALLVLWALWAHDAPLISDVVDIVPGLAYVPRWVSQTVGTFCVAVLAAFELDELLKSGARRRVGAALTTLLQAAAVLWLATPAAHELITTVADDLVTAPEKVARAHAHVDTLALWIGGAALALATACVIVNSRVRAALVALTLAAVFAQTAGVFAPYQTVCADRYVYPQTRAMITLRRLLGDGEYVSLTREGLPANANLLYGRRQPANYDALLVAHFEAWYSETCMPVDMWHAAIRANEAALWMLGVELCTLRPPGVGAPAEINGAPSPHWNGAPERLELLGRIGGQLVHRFDRPAARARLVSYATRCESDQQWLARSTRNRPNLEESLLLGPQTPATFAIRSAPESAEDSEASKQARGQRRRARAEEAAERTIDDSDAATERGGARAARRGARARPQTARAEVAVIDELPTALTMRVEQDEPHYLLVAKAHYPGWNAYLDGSPTELVRANYAFSALDVPAGEHMVELRYEPASWRWGLALFAAGSAALAAMWFVTRRQEMLR